MPLTGESAPDGTMPHLICFVLGRGRPPKIRHAIVFLIAVEMGNLGLRKWGRAQERKCDQTVTCNVPITPVFKETELYIPVVSFTVSQKIASRSSA